MRCETIGASGKIENIYIICVHNGWSTAYQIRTFNAWKRTDHRHPTVANIFLVANSHVQMTNITEKLDLLPNNW